MKTIEQLSTQEVIKQHGETLSAIESITDTNLHWSLQQLLPKGKRIDTMPVDQLKQYLGKRLTARTDKKLEAVREKIQSIFSAPKLISVNISVEWKKNRTWGANPTATIEVHTDKGFYRYVSGSVSGCGYDKESTAVAEALNQSPSVLRELYEVVDTRRSVNPSESLRDILGYGSGYGILPRFEGGVGVDCFRSIFNTIGFNWQKSGSGKMFDVYTVTK